MSQNQALLITRLAFVAMETIDMSDETGISDLTPDSDPACDLKQVFPTPCRPLALPPSPHAPPTAPPRAPDFSVTDSHCFRGGSSVNGCRVGVFVVGSRAWDVLFCHWAPFLMLVCPSHKGPCLIFSCLSRLGRGWGQAALARRVEGENRGTERLGNLHKVTQLLSDQD